MKGVYRCHQKLKTQKNRWRNKTVSFRISPEEAELLNKYANLSGLSKQDYLISKVLCKEVTVTPSSRIQKALKDEIEELVQALENVKVIDINSDLLELSEHILKMLVELKK